MLSGNRQASKSRENLKPKSDKRMTVSTIAVLWRVEKHARKRHCFAPTWCSRRVTHHNALSLARYLPAESACITPHSYDNSAFKLS